MLFSIKRSAPTRLPADKAPTAKSDNPKVNGAAIPLTKYNAPVATAKTTVPAASPFGLVLLTNLW